MDVLPSSFKKYICELDSSLNCLKTLGPVEALLSSILSVQQHSEAGTNVIPEPADTENFTTGLQSHSKYQCQDVNQGGLVFRALQYHCLRGINCTVIRHKPYSQASCSLIHRTHSTLCLSFPLSKMELSHKVVLRIECDSTCKFQGIEWELNMHGHPITIEWRLNRPGDCLRESPVNRKDQWGLLNLANVCY